MKQEAFEELYSPDWSTFEEWIEAMAGGFRNRNKLDDETRAEIGQKFPVMYRQVCHHLALARTRRYSIGLQQRLNQLALEGHQHLYRSRTPLFSAIGRFLANDFPAVFRQRWRYVLASALIFYLPAVLMALAVQARPEIVYSLIEPGQVSAIEEMYDPENSVLGRERESETDVFMFGYYIYNNISIGFQTFAGGLVFGLGSVFYLFFNGLFFGAVTSHLASVGYSGTFLPFVSGHSSWELTAIVIFGGVGLMIGHAAIAPGRKRRWHAIRDRAVDGMPLVYGGTLMLVIAAFVEAFWSSTTWPPNIVKYIVGAFFWMCLGLYFGLLGRNES